MRQTPLQNTVTQIFKETPKPFSVPEIQAQLATLGLTPNKTSLYRLLDKLKQSGLIEEVLLDPKTTYYEIKTDHHHHFVCHDCNTIECIKDPALEDQIHQFEDRLSSHGLKVQQHQFSFSGSCNRCQ